MQAIFQELGAGCLNTGDFDVASVRHWGRAFRRMPAGSLPRLSVEMGLTAVVATQLWHHLFIGGNLTEA